MTDDYNIHLVVKYIMKIKNFLSGQKIYITNFIRVLSIHQSLGLNVQFSICIYMSKMRRDK